MVTVHKNGSCIPRETCGYVTRTIIVHKTWLLNRRLSLLPGNAAMPRLDPATRNNVIGRLQGGQSQPEVDRQFKVHQSRILHLWQRLNQTGSAEDRPRSGNPCISAPAQDWYIMLFHLRNRTVTATTTAAWIPGLRRISAQTVRNRIRQYGIRP